MLTRRHVIHAGAAAAALAAPSLLLAAPQPLIGLSLPKTGIQAEIANELLLGYELAIKASGSVLGLKVLDDQSKEDLTAKNFTELAGDPSVVAGSGIVGTPHAIAAVPVAIAKGLPVVGLRSGADALRTGKPGVYHLRASFDQEIAKLVALVKGSALSAIVAICSNDAFGKGVAKQLQAQMVAQGVRLLEVIPAERDGSDMAAATSKAAQLVKTNNGMAVGVFLILITKPMDQAAMLLRDTHSLVMPLFAMSFTATKSIVTSPKKHLVGLGLVTAFPLPSGSDSLAIQYRTAVDKFGTQDMLLSLTSLEGFFYGSVIAAAAVGGAATREGIQRKLIAGLILPLFYIPQIQKLRRDHSGLAAYSLRKAIAQLALRGVGMVYIVVVNQDPFIVLVIAADVLGRSIELAVAITALRQQRQRVRHSIETVQM